MKPILCMCLCLLSVSGFCQVKVGVQVGYNHTTFSGKDILPVADYYYHASSLPGFNFNAGMIASVPLLKQLSLQPSLLLSEKGAKETEGGGFTGSYSHTHLHLYYAHLPVQVMYSFINKNEWQVSVGAGGFVSKGIWGTSQQSYESYDTTGQHHTVHTSKKVNFTNDPDNYQPGKRNAKPWDYGYTVAAIAGWKNWQLKAAYDFGVVDIAQRNHRSGVFSLSAGYYFVTGKKKQSHSEACK